MNEDCIGWLPVAALKVDTRYQRAVSTAKVNKMAREWNALAVDIVVVSLRGDGYYIIDGQHRVAAAVKRGIARLLCQVHIDLSIEDEAILFRVKNANRKSPNKIQLFNALLIGRDATAETVHELISSSGRVVRAGSKHWNAIHCVGALYDSVRSDEQAMRRIWPVITDLCCEQIIDEQIVKGFFWAETNLSDGRSIAEDAISQRIVRFGLPRIRSFIQRSIFGNSASTHRTWGLGIVAAANHGVREANHLRIKEKS